jgi:hypothetical protein
MLATSAPVSGAAQSTPETWPANAQGIGETIVGIGVSSNVRPLFIRNLSQPIQGSISFFFHLDYHPRATSKSAALVVGRDESPAENRSYLHERMRRAKLGKAPSNLGSWSRSH